jgi:hypothetical protein
MAANPYAAPTAQVADVRRDGIDAPALWNPNAAANWSLLFTPIFGAFLHMRNWQALDEPASAARAKGWVIASIAVLVFTVILALSMKSEVAANGVGKGVGLVWLLTWYFGSGRAHARYVKEAFGKDYPRRGWGMPLLIAVGVTIVYALVIGTIAAAITYKGMAGR